MKLIPASMSQTVSRHILKLQKDSPRVLFVAGIAGVVGSTILACRATLKLEATIDHIQKDVDAVKSNPAVVGNNEKKELARVYMSGTLDLVRLYGPSVLLGAASITALTTSHVTLTKRNAGLTAAYSAVAASYEAYRDRVREQLGEAKELDIYHAATTEKVEVDGKIKSIKTVDPNRFSPYARIFDESNPLWVKNPEYNKIKIRVTQNYLNDLLHARGHVFLNEAYHELGFEHTPAGAVVGWVVGNGDNYIDFGLYEARSAQFVNGVERSIILDFNVDGPIWNLI